MTRKAELEFYEVIESTFDHMNGGDAWRDHIISKLRLLSDNTIHSMYKCKKSHWTRDVFEAIEQEHLMRKMERKLFEVKDG
jgi:hypothetical protein